MKRRVSALILGALLALSMVGAALANTGYEGQPGNQSNDGGGGNTGYEGQPGNQSH
jgi:Spy/CpxP family protein refolding chaperone